MFYKGDARFEATVDLNRKRGIKVMYPLAYRMKT
jgi:hypothetical protein